MKFRQCIRASVVLCVPYTCRYMYYLYNLLIHICTVSIDISTWYVLALKVNANNFLLLSFSTFYRPCHFKTLSEN
jgi:hypothetical protein